jgi:gliding motility-associated-like protein
MVLVFVKTGLTTHNRAGEISFEQIGPLTLEVTLTTYTKTSSIAADRDSVEIFWGDGTSEFAVRANGWGDPQPNDVKINYYIATHTYPARASYTISMYDPNRVGGILNVNYPDSESVPFYLATTFTFLNTQFQGENNSVVLLQAPIDFGCVGEVFIHNPNAYDKDGDSIAYKLIVPLQGQNAIVPDYVYPDQIEPGQNNKLTLNPKTGDLVWDAPQLPGEYNVAIVIEEYRSGTLINSMIRDMQIFILDDCQNTPPSLNLTEELCVFAGDTVSVKINVDDPDNGQLVRLEASGAPFISTRNLARLDPPPAFQEVSFVTQMEWITSCEDVSDQYYQILFKAMDNGISDTSGLATLKILKVKVMAPAPKSMNINLEEDHVKLKWQYPYFCAFTENDYFIGFSIWRSNQSQNLNLDSCATGLEGRGYDKIVFLHDQNNGIEYIFEDMDVEPGENYCYRVVPEFAKFSFDGFPYNQVAGKPSDEVCISLPVNLPYITKNSVDETDVLDGRIEMHWKFFNPEQFDTLTYPGPYKVDVLKSADGLAYSLIPEASRSFESPLELNEVIFIDEQLDTENTPYYYYLDLYSGPQEILVGSSKEASSIYLNLSPADSEIRLDFKPEVPWYNQLYRVYRKQLPETDFELLTTTSVPYFVDEGLDNGMTYCYIVESEGNYLFDPDFVISNISQERCAIPNDITAPCAPLLELINPCDTISDQASYSSLENLLNWSFDPAICELPKDLAGFNIYYSPDSTGLNLTQIISLNDKDIRAYSHTSELGLKGCYAITAYDGNGNESEFSNVLCSENCPVYILPNVFTPNNDGTNDYFQPKLIRHIFEVDMKIFNQWGQLVYQTDDPLINWDGTNINGNALSEGTYHYICRLSFPVSDEGTETKVLSGFIQIIRGQ